MARQKLRPYQERGLAEVLDAYKNGARRVLMTLPTGGGKTTVFVELAASIKGRVVVLVHRRELATQAANRFREWGVDFGYVMAGEVSRPQARVQIASVQTLVRRKCPPAVLVIADEAHLSTAATWQTILDQYPHAKILGCTATPWRLGGKPLVGTYDASVVVATPAELRAEGALCQYNGFSYKAPDLSGVKKTGGEYNEKQSGEAMREPAIVTDIVEKWQKHASTLSTVVFAVTVEHSQQLTAQFKAAGVRAEHLDGSMGKVQRDAILARVAAGTTQVLCNVGVAVEGLDIPRLKCCVLARPTMSLARAIQMMGRVRRPWGGLTARIHDHAFVIRAHGLPDAERDYTLHARNEEPAPLSQCSQCFAYYTPGVGCPSCEHVDQDEVERRELATIDSAEQVDFSSADEAPAAERPPVQVEWNAIGRLVEGIFEGAEESAGPYGPQVRFVVKGPKRRYSMPGTQHLKALMRPVRIGDGVRVKYTGNAALPGGKTRKIFEVERDAAEDKEEASRREEARRLYVDEKKSLSDVGKALGVAASTVHVYATEDGWIRARWSAEKVEEARALYTGGKTSGEVSKAIGVPAATVQMWGASGGWLRSAKDAAATDPRLIKRAQKLYPRSNKDEDVALALGVSRTTVSKWARVHPENLSNLRCRSPRRVEFLGFLGSSILPLPPVSSQVVARWGRAGGWTRSKSDAAQLRASP